jgi:hypothetical protein
MTRPNDFVVSANHAIEVTHSKSSFHLDLLLSFKQAETKITIAAMFLPRSR